MNRVYCFNFLVIKMFLVQIKETCGALFNYSLNFKLI